MTFLKKSVILLTANLVIGCAEGLPPFPADFVFVAKPDKLECTRHKIISKDPIKVDKGEFIPWSECPHVFGFQDSDIGPVMNWIRESQRLAKKRCK
jgi:hypothetical protein